VMGESMAVGLRSKLVTVCLHLRHMHSSMPSGIREVFHSCAIPLSVHRVLGAHLIILALGLDGSWRSLLRSARFAILSSGCPVLSLAILSSASITILRISLSVSLSDSLSQCARTAWV
jgi:hypothetical protein